MKGNEIGQENLRPITKEMASEMGRRGAEKSNEVQRRNKMLKEELRDILNEETTKGSGVTKMQAVIQNVLKNTLSKGKAQDLKTLAEVLGEMEINVNLNQAEKPRIVFDDGCKPVLLVGEGDNRSDLENTAAIRRKALQPTKREE